MRIGKKSERRKKGKNDREFEPSHYRQMDAFRSLVKVNMAIKTPL